MSLLSWLTGSKPEKRRDRRGPALQFPPPPAPAAPTVVKPQAAPPTPEPAPPPSPSGQALRKAERAANREILYPIVRESMLKAGILSTRYTFKLLTTDTHGEKFMVMVDMAPEFLGDMEKLNEIEALITRAALSRHNLRVAGTYWRANAMVGSDAHSAGAPSSQSRIASTLPDPWSAPAAAPAKAGPARPDAPKGPSNYGMLTGYEQTEMMDDDDDTRTPALSATQYGHPRK